MNGFSEKGFSSSLQVRKTVDYLGEEELAVVDSLRAQFAGKKGRWTSFYKYIVHVDANGDGLINLKEFTKCMKKVFKDKTDTPNEEMIRQIFVKIGKHFIIYLKVVASLEMSNFFSFMFLFVGLKNENNKNR